MTNVAIAAAHREPVVRHAADVASQLAHAARFTHRLHAIGGPLQLLKTADAFTLALGQVQGDELTQVAERLAAYHDIPAEDDADFQRRLTALRALDRRISAAHQVHHQGAVAAVLIGVAKESEDEHRALVASVAADQPDHLPIDTTGLEEDDRVTLLALWRSIVNGTGNIRIKGGETTEFRDRMRAAIAKLLQGPYGRELIATLNAPAQGDAMRVTLGSDFTQELRDTALSQGTDDEALPLSDRFEDQQKAYDLKVTHDEVAPEDFSVFNPADHAPAAAAAAFDVVLQNAVRDGHQYVRVGGTMYKRGTGTGSHVRITSRGAGTLVGAGDRAVLNPEFVTVGHELGHARRLLTGTSVSSTIDARELGVEGELDKRLWTSTEELVNIRGVENPIRAEHHLGERVYHRGDVDNVRKEKNLEAFGDAVAAEMVGLGGWERQALKAQPVFRECMNEITDKAASWSNNGTALATTQRLIPELRRVIGTLGQGRFRVFWTSVDEVRDRVTGWAQQALQRTHQWRYLQAERTGTRLNWALETTATQMRAQVSTLEDVLRVLHQIQLAGSWPEQLEASAGETVRRDLALDGGFASKKRAFIALLNDAPAMTLIAQLPDVADDLAAAARRVTIARASEPEPAPSPWSFLGM